MTVFCIAAGLLCLCYFFFLLLYTGFTSAFYLIWPAMGAGFLLLGRLFRIRFWQLLPGIIRCLLLGAVILGIFFFAAVEGMILRGSLTVPEKGLDYVVVLGAHVRPEGPSRALRLRLERALTYARENPSSILIVSGGQGDNEPCTESSAMKNWLVSHGMEPERILEEDQSKNTRQNLAFSKKMIPEGASVGIVSSDFHICRALHLAETLGYDTVCGIPARGDLPTQPSNLLREFFAVVKDFWIL